MHLLRRWTLTIDWRAMKKDWKHHAEREMLSRAEWWEARGNKRLAKEYIEAIADMKSVTSGNKTLVEEDYQDN